MNEPTKSYSEKMAIMDEFIKRVNPYEKPQPLNFDIRGYSDYLDEHGIDGKNVPQHIVEKFKL